MTFALILKKNKEKGLWPGNRETSLGIFAVLQKKKKRSHPAESRFFSASFV